MARIGIVLMICAAATWGMGCGSPADEGQTTAHAATRAATRGGEAGGAHADKDGHEGHDHEGHDHEHHDHDHAHHDHSAPRGGTLIALGDHFAHMEVVVDTTGSQVAAYVLDGEAEEAIRLEQETIELEMTPRSADAATTPGGFVVTLFSTDNPLTGETIGNSSEFRGRDARLAGLKEFDARIVAVEIKGQRLEGIAFKYPEGNE